MRGRLQLEMLEDRIAPTVFTVTNTNDSGNGSLRQAIANANSLTGADTIVFDPAVFGTPRTISLESGTLLVSDGVTVTGPGAGLLTVSRDPIADHFRIFNFTGNFSATLSGMTITGGYVEVNDGSGGGGGLSVHDAASVTVQDSVITGNISLSPPGAGIYMHAGALTVRNSTVSGNTANLDSSIAGGGIVAAFGTLLVENSTISGNIATNRIGGESDGGGVLVAGGIGNWTIRNSTIAGNTAGSRGGGIAVETGSGSSPLVIQNCTIAGNKANGIFNGQGGGGIARLGGPVSIASTIVANNNAGTTALDVLGSITANNSLIQNSAGATISGSNNILAMDPKLGPLQYNGGPTFTMALLPGSPAIDAGSNPAGLATDQRGAGFARVSGPQADIGAFEVQRPTAMAAFADVTTAGGTGYTLTVTYADATAVNVATLDSNDIRVTGPNGFNALATFVGVDNTANGTPRIATYRLTPPGGSWDRADDGAYRVTVEPGQVFNTAGADMPAGTVGTFQVLLPTLTVTNTSNSGPGSLRQAILTANATPGPDVIAFDSSFNTPRTISLTTTPDATNPSALTVTDSLAIVGPGASLLTVRRDSAASTFRVFDVKSGAAAVIDVSISGMTISGGSTAGVAAGTNGSGVTGDGA
ncbi:MAG TPA: right-handed parallel beta-helix repeat-containing protein, partial [Gemmataceae bacterium]|nr:right-handed parallel beta-helix repeat-containing protein [Gemmataceae bacterium]